MGKMGSLSAPAGSVDRPERLVQHPKQKQKNDDRQRDADDPENAAFAKFFHDAFSSNFGRVLVGGRIVETRTRFPFRMM